MFHMLIVIESPVKQESGEVIRGMDAGGKYKQYNFPFKFTCHMFIVLKGNLIIIQSHSTYM